MHGLVVSNVSMSSKPRLLTRSACRNCSSLWPLQPQHLRAVAVPERLAAMGSLPPHSEMAAGPGTIRRGAPEDAAFLARCNVDHGLVSKPVLRVSCCSAFWTCFNAQHSTCMMCCRR